MAQRMDKMGERYKASLIIPTHRRQVLLRNLLASLCNQKTEHEFEVVVVNDGSGEDLSYLEVEFSQISTKVVNLQENLGRSAARNAGADQASGSILIFLDDDMTVVEDFVAHHINSHTDDQEAVIGNVLSAPQYAAQPLARFIQRQGIHKLKPGAPIHPKCFRTGNASLSQALFARAGRFDETLRTYGEDLDLAMKLHYCGAKFVFAPGAISYNHNPSDLDDMIGKMREFGGYTLPIFAERHPEIARAHGIHLAQPVRIGGEGLGLTMKKLGLRLLLTRPVYGVALLAYRLGWLGKLLFPVIDFIRLYNYVTAYWESKRARGAR